MEPKLGAPQICPECGAYNKSGLILPEQCEYCDNTKEEWFKDIKIGDYKTTSSGSFARERTEEESEAIAEFVKSKSTIKRIAVQQPLEIAELYSELIMAVETKFPDETRHETALRYIKEAENSFGTKTYTDLCQKRSKDE